MNASAQPRATTDSACLPYKSSMHVRMTPCVARCEQYFSSCSLKTGHFLTRRSVFGAAARRNGRSDTCCLAIFWMFKASTTLWSGFSWHAASYLCFWLVGSRPVAWTRFPLSGRPVSHEKPNQWTPTLWRIIRNISFYRSAITSWLGRTKEKNVARRTHFPYEKSGVTYILALTTAEN